MESSEMINHKGGGGGLSWLEAAPGLKVIQMTSVPILKKSWSFTRNGEKLVNLNSKNRKKMQRDRSHRHTELFW